MAITRIDGVGASLAKNLIGFCGSASAVFSKTKSQLQKIPGIGYLTANNIHQFNEFDGLIKEMELNVKRGIQSIPYTDSLYPTRLKNYDDSPVLIYVKGQLNLNSKRIVSIVGTRTSTPYGRNFTFELIQKLKQHEVVVLSGLANGTDTNAHQACVKYGLPTGECWGMDSLLCTQVLINHFQRRCFITVHS
ncbi:MAG: DNA-processing protein DprA [Bacteroidia bacterium]